MYFCKFHLLLLAGFKAGLTNMAIFKMSSRFTLPFLLGIAGLVTIIISTIIILNNPKIIEITWLASFFIVSGTLVIRFYSIDVDGFAAIINQTDPVNTDLDGRKFLNWMTIAMIVGLAATIIIHYSFEIGMGSYLLMQVALIKSFSGIFPLRMSTIKNSGFGTLKKAATRSIIFWITTVILIYTIFIYSGVDSLIVVPYVIAIGIMTHYTWYGLVYSKRSKFFRWFPVIASGLFFFSDALIGADLFGSFDVNIYLVHLIDLTYVFNIFLMSQAMLFQGPLREK